jgi:hypothetical protein
MSLSKNTRSPNCRSDFVTVWPRLNCCRDECGKLTPTDQKVADGRNDILAEAADIAAGEIPLRRGQVIV